MSKFEESNFYKALQDFFINADKKTFLQFLAEFYNRTEGIIDKNNIQDDLIKELRELYLEFNEKGIDENIVREKVNYFLENSLKIKDINSKLNTNTNNIKNINSQLDTIAVDVKKFGAKGDGVTDDTLSINNTINYVVSMGGGTVLIPTGTYLCSNIILKSNVILKGSGTGSTVLKAYSSNVQIIKGENWDTLKDYTEKTDALGVRNTKICDLRIDGDNKASVGIEIWGCYLEFENLFIEKCLIQGIHTKFTTHTNLTINNAFENLLESKFTNIKIAYCGKGWLFEGPHDSIIDNLVIVGSKDWAFEQGTKRSFVVGTNWNFWTNKKGILINSGMSGNYIVVDGGDIGIELTNISGNAMISNYRTRESATGLILRGTSSVITGVIQNSTQAIVIEECGFSNLNVIAIGNTNLIQNISETAPNWINVTSSNVNGKVLTKNFLNATQCNISVQSNSNSFNQLSNTKLRVGGWSPSLPQSNGIILTNDMKATETTRGGILLQPKFDNITSPPTVEDFNLLLNRLTNAGILSHN